MEKIEKDFIYSLAEAAKIEELPEYVTLRRYVERGELKAYKRAGRYFIKGSDLINFSKNYEQNGLNPKKDASVSG